MVSEPLYVPRLKVARLLAISRPAVVRLAERGLIGTRRLPGEPARYCWADAVRLLAESTTAATAGGATDGSPTTPKPE